MYVGHEGVTELWYIEPDHPEWIFMSDFVQAALHRQNQNSKWENLSSTNSFHRSERVSETLSLFYTKRHCSSPVEAKHFTLLYLTFY